MYFEFQVLEIGNDYSFKEFRYFEFTKVSAFMWIVHPGVYKLVLVLTLVVMQLSCREKKVSTIEMTSIRVINDFFEKSKDDNAKAINELLSSNPNIDLQDSTTIELEKGLGKIYKHSGEFIEYRLLRKKILGDDIASFSYLVKFEKIFFRFNFIFYCVKGKTLIYKFSYDDVLDEEIEQSLKLYRNELEE